MRFLKVAMLAAALSPLASHATLGGAPSASTPAPTMLRAMPQSAAGTAAAKTTTTASYTIRESRDANGILGIGHGTHDSKDALTTPLPGNYYYRTAANVCFSTRMSINKEVMNPVAAFSSDNNGTIIRLPKLPPGGCPYVFRQALGADFGW